MRAQLAVDQHRFGVFAPGAAEVDAALGHALADKAAMGEDVAKALALRRRGGGRIADVGHAAVAAAVDALNRAAVKPRGRAAEDEVDVAADQAAPVDVVLRDARRMLLGADEAVLLDLPGRERRSEERVLRAQQAAVLAEQAVAVGVERDGLARRLAGRGVVFNRQAAQRDTGRIRAQRRRAEGAALAPVGKEGVGGVAPDDARAVGAGALERRVGPIDHDLFAIDAGREAQHGRGAVPRQEIEGALQDAFLQIW